MGKGDKRSKRGKIVIGSYGKTRSHKVAAPVATDDDKKKKTAKKGPAAKKS